MLTSSIGVVRQMACREHGPQYGQLLPRSPLCQQVPAVGERLLGLDWCA